MSHTPPPTREEIARRDLGQTQVAPWLARAMTALFLAAIALVPAWETVRRVREQEGFAGLRLATDASSEEPSAMRRFLDANAAATLWMAEFERRYESDHWLAAVFQPAQVQLIRLAGLSTEGVYPGRDGWLFHRPGVEHISGPGFLERQADPLHAILDFHRQLAVRDIRLIVLPTPDKAAMHPEKLTSRFAGQAAAPLRNRSFQEFIHRLEGAGVIVCDPAMDLVEQSRQTEKPQFLRADTHWTPQGMVRATELLASLIRPDLDPNAPDVPMAAFTQEVSYAGDLAMLLTAGEASSLYPGESVIVRKIASLSGRDWQPSAGAEVLLLGDSFANIFSLPEMKWGASAGLAEQLSFALRRPVDRIARNDQGAFATRQAFAQALRNEPERFAATRIVVWQFAERELSLGDWKVVPLPEPTKSTGQNQSEGSLAARAKILAVAELPPPGTAPYREALVAWHVALHTDSKSQSVPAECVVYLWGMRNNRLLGPARAAAGDEHQLRLTPWQQAERIVGRFARAELDDPDFKLLVLPVFFGELVE